MNSIGPSWESERPDDLPDSRSQINDILGECPPPAEPEWIGDALHLYRQGWSIRRIAAELDSGYGVIRRHLGMRLRLRDRSGSTHAAVRIGDDTDAAEKGGR